jgi:hypothetical protein
MLFVRITMGLNNILDLIVKKIVLFTYSGLNREFELRAKQRQLNFMNKKLLQNAGVFC